MDLIYDAPWWLYVVPVAAGVAMAFVALRKGDKTMRNVGLGLVLVGLAILGLSRVVETDTEAVTRRSRELVAAVESRDWNKVSALLDPKAAVTLLNFGQLYTNREQILAAVQSRADGSGVQSLVVTRAEPKREGSLITTEMEVYVTANDAGGQPFPTGWLFVWTQRGDQWVVRDIEAVQLGHIRGGDVRAWFPRVP